MFRAGGGGGGGNRKATYKNEFGEISKYVLKRLVSSKSSIKK